VACTAFKATERWSVKPRVKPKMTTDKRQSLDNLLADIFREPPLISTDIEPAPSASPDQPPTASAFSDQPASAIPDQPPSAVLDQPASAIPDQTTSAVPDQALSAVPDQPPSAVPDPPNGEVSDPQTPIADTSPNTEKAVKLAEQAKSLLAGLNRDTAIRLRWAMRDIKAKRTKLTPVNPDDLEALLDLGFVEMRDGTPALTDTGFRALD